MTDFVVFDCLFWLGAWCFSSRASCGWEGPGADTEHSECCPAKIPTKSELSETTKSSLIQMYLETAIKSHQDQHSFHTGHMSLHVNIQNHYKFIKYKGISQPTHTPHPQNNELCFFINRPPSPLPPPNNPKKLDLWDLNFGCCPTGPPNTA